MLELLLGGEIGDFVTRLSDTATFYQTRYRLKFDHTTMLETELHLKELISYIVTAAFKCTE